MGWFSALFSSKKVVDTAMDTVKDIRDGIDMLVYTDEEKAIYHAKISEVILKRSEVALQESSIKSMTRRIIAVSVVLIAEFLTVVLLVGYLAKFDKPMMLGVWSLLQFWAVPLGIVLAFYLGYYGISQIKEAGK